MLLTSREVDMERGRESVEKERLSSSAGKEYIAPVVCLDGKGNMASYLP